MDSCNGKHLIKTDILSVIEKNTGNDSSKDTLDSLKLGTKIIYDHLQKDNFLTELKTKSFRKLLIDGFDNEQIFQQIELQNKSAWDHFHKHINNINDSNCVQIEANDNDALSDSENNDSLMQDYKEMNSSKRKGEYIFDDDSDASLSDSEFKNLKFPSESKKGFDENLSDEEEKDETFDNIEESDEEEKDETFDNIEESDEEEKDETFENEDDLATSPKSPKSKKVRFQNQSKKYKSAVDDQFFKLSNLEEFLKIEDLKAENKLEEVDDDEEEDIDYFQDIPSEDDIDFDDELENDTKSTKDIMYDDFFDAPEFGDEGIDEKDSDMDEDDSKDFDMDKNNADENAEVMSKNDEKATTTQKEIPKTPFELMQEKVKEEILTYEELLVQKAEWHLTGEVAASNRPKDSLLHKETEFDLNRKPVLVESADLEEKTEKIILSIIKNKAFSDGQRTFKPENDFAKKTIVLDQSKSKKSLAEVYEEEYKKKKYGEMEEENPKHVEIKKMMDIVLPELQALFCHIPKPAIPDIKIVSNLPAITVEEVAPTSISDALLLAPEEVKKKSGLIKGQTERTDTDRKRERRKKKLFQKNKFKKMLAEDSTGKSGKLSTVQKLNTIKKLKQNRNTKIAELGEEKIKSSTDFFARLQETVNSKVQASKSKKRKA